MAQYACVRQSSEIYTIRRTKKNNWEQKLNNNKHRKETTLNVNSSGACIYKILFIKISFKITRNNFPRHNQFTHCAIQGLLAKITDQRFRPPLSWSITFDPSRVSRSTKRSSTLRHISRVREDKVWSNDNICTDALIIFLTIQFFERFEFFDERFVLVLQHRHSVLQTFDVLFLFSSTLPRGFLIYLPVFQEA